MKRLWGQCLSLVERFRRRPLKYRLVYTEEIPDRLKKHILYAVGEGTPWLAVLQCPCGCGDVINLSLLERDSPRWFLHREGDGAITLSPSVWRSKGCRSHFLIRKSVVMWCDTKKTRVSRLKKRR